MHTLTTYSFAAHQAWSIYLERHPDVAPDDARRSILERYMREHWSGANADLDELTCSGLGFLSRVDVSSEEL